MIRYIVYIFMILINFILQTTLLSYIEIFNIIPNTMLILIISFAFMRGEIDGALIGFLSGILVDSFYGQILGLNAFIALVVGFVCGKIFNEFNKDGIIIPFFITFVFSLFYGVLTYFFNAFLKGYPNILPFLKSIIIPEAIYTSLISVIIYRILYIINTKIEKFDRRKKNLFKQ